MSDFWCQRILTDVVHIVLIGHSSQHLQLQLLHVRGIAESAIEVFVVARKEHGSALDEQVEVAEDGVGLLAAAAAHESEQRGFDTLVHLHKGTGWAMGMGNRMGPALSLVVLCVVSFLFLFS